MKNKEIVLSDPSHIPQEAIEEKIINEIVSLVVNSLTSEHSCNCLVIGVKSQHLTPYSPLYSHILHMLPIYHIYFSAKQPILFTSIIVYCIGLIFYNQSKHFV